MSNLRKDTIKAFKWNSIGNLITYGGSFLFSILLARLLSPEEFGLLGMVMVFIGISQGLVDVGFSSAIVQKQEVTDKQLSTVFYINLLLGVFLFLLFCMLAKPIALFYKIPLVENITYLASLLFIINGVGQVQKSLLTKELRYNVIAKISIAAVILSGILAIIISYKGGGVYALIIQQLSMALLSNLFFWFNSKWRPRLIFSLNAVKELFDYGIRLFFSSILHSAYLRLDAFIIGKVFSASTLGLYSRSLGFKSIVDILSTNGLQILFPVFSRKQNELDNIKSMFLLLYKTVGIFSLFLSSILWLIAIPLFLFLLGDDWVKAGEYFKIIMIGGFVGPLSSIMINVIKALGKSDVYLKLEVYKKAVQIPAFIIAFYFSIEVFIWTKVSLMILAFCVNILFVSNVLKIKFITLLKILLKQITILLIPITVTIFFTQNLSYPPFLNILIIGLLFSVLSIPLILYTQKESLLKLKNVIF